MKPGDKEQREREQQLERELRSQIFSDDVKWIMSEKRGRRFIARLLKTYGEDPTSSVTSFTGNSATFELEGMRKAGKILQSNLIRLEPDNFLLLLKENFILPERIHDR